jgi:hypothetical protein
MLIAMRRSMSALALALSLIGAAACHPPASPAEAAAVARVAPEVGATAPAGTLHTADGSALALADAWPKHAHNVLVFYRGFY